jgi:hypothetical protein
LSLRCDDGAHTQRANNGQGTDSIVQMLEMQGRARGLWAVERKDVYKGKLYRNGHWAGQTVVCCRPLPVGG